MAVEDARGMRVLAICGGLGLLYAVGLGTLLSATRTLPWALGAVLPCYLAGLALCWKAPAHPVARRALATGSWAALGLVVRFTVAALGSVAGWVPGPAASWPLLLLARTIDVIAAVMTARLLALLPDGREHHARERITLRLLWLLLAAPLVLMTVPMPQWLELRLLVQPEAWMPAIGAGLLLAHSLPDTQRPHARNTRRWSAVAAAALALFAARGSMRLFRMWQGDSGPAYFIGCTLGALPYVLISAGLVYAAFRHRLPGLDFTARRSTVYGLLWVIIGGWYLGMVTALGLTASQYLPISAAVLVAVAATMLFQPLRQQLNQLAARRVFGVRRSNFELLVQFGTTLEHAYDLTLLAPQLAVSLQEWLVLRWVKVELGTAGPGRLPSARGTAGTMPDGTDSSPTRVRLCYGDDVLGFIEYGPKAQGRFTPEDRDLVETLARQAALAVHNARLNAELSIRIEEVQRQASELNASRTRIVQAQDTERRRIERQLHDGIQQELVALVAKLRLARNQLCRNGDTVHTTLTELQDDACRVIDGLRELAHGIHPPVLTDQGLAAAVMSRARRLPIPVTVEIEPSVRAARFTPDIEEAAFFVVSEALTNVLKHARAAGVTVRIGRAGGSLLLDVSDDGVGLCSTAGLGSGLTGMRDRIEAVGGELSIISRPGDGTTLQARITETRRETADV
ncbi:GAF domain-containing sensor histidine kinase [Streptomyces sp. MUSC 14]|uniref:GAF domain-containing sensor histidine kinase n=1 Tax=Streptomyces sp. MUSC 14 TaxID=1354889 RepID=UPI000D19E31F|nr:GAF domain-containing sensor histidine kinase [Streptomyces sp. MUSC 14]